MGSPTISQCPRFGGILLAKNTDHETSEGLNKRHTGDIAGTVAYIDHIAKGHRPLAEIHRLVHDIRVVPIFSADFTLLDEEDTAGFIREGQRLLHRDNPVAILTVSEGRAPDSMDGVLEALRDRVENIRRNLTGQSPVPRY